MDKKLIYFTLNNNENYIKLAQLCIDSLNQTDYDGDLLFITNNMNLIRDNVRFKENVHIHFCIVPTRDLFNSAASKLEVYRYQDLNKYDKIIYCDLDIIWIKSPNYIFDIINEYKIYFAQETNNLISNKYFNCGLFTQQEIDDIQKNYVWGLNTGVFAFNKNMINHLYHMNKLMIENLHLVNECLEQPYINTYVYRNNIYNTSLTHLINNGGIHGIEINNIRPENVLNHFSGGPGNFSFKFHRMIEFLKYYQNINNKYNDMY